jgi:hypothetical protein
MATRTTDDLAGYARRYIVAKPHVTGVLLSPSDRRTLNLTEASLLGAGPSQ